MSYNENDIPFCLVPKDSYVYLWKIIYNCIDSNEKDVIIGGKIKLSLKFLTEFSNVCNFSFINACYFTIQHFAFQAVALYFQSPSFYLRYSSG